MKHLFLFICLIFLTACSRNNSDENCKFLVNAAVNASVNLNLPQYSQLKFTSNSVYLANQGNKGVIVMNVGSSYRAWDAADPNHEQSTCSLLTITGANAVCGCIDANTYSLFTGGSIGTQLPCGLKEYRVTQSGNSLIIIN
jgi:nitrite reductase/ring-hydroxylating ferredoxin subunit